MTQLFLYSMTRCRNNIIVQLETDPGSFLLMDYQEVLTEVTHDILNQIHVEHFLCHIDVSYNLVTEANGTVLHADANLFFMSITYLHTSPFSLSDSHLSLISLSVPRTVCPKTSSFGLNSNDSCTLSRAANSKKGQHPNHYAAQCNTLLVCFSISLGTSLGNPDIEDDTRLT